MEPAFKKDQFFRRRRHRLRYCCCYFLHFFFFVHLSFGYFNRSIVFSFHHFPSSSKSNFSRYLPLPFRLSCWLCALPKPNHKIYSQNYWCWCLSFWRFVSLLFALHSESVDCCCVITVCVYLKIPYRNNEKNKRASERSNTVPMCVCTVQCIHTTRHTDGNNNKNSA